MTAPNNTPQVSDTSVTALLTQLSAGNREAETRLIAEVYTELRRLAAGYTTLPKAGVKRSATTKLPSSTPPPSFA